MDNQCIARRVTKRRRVNSSSAVRNQLLPRKIVIVLDDTWLEALKHLTGPQWSKMGFVCRQVYGIVQRNISRLPRQVIESVALNSTLFHPASYIKNVTMCIVTQKLIDANFNGEERYICCQMFALLPFSSISVTPQKIAQSLEWLLRNVRSDSITLPHRMFNRIHINVKIRTLLTDFIFDASQKCKARKFIFSFNDYLHESQANGFSSVKLIDILIEDFMALSVVQGTIPTLVIDRYPDLGLYRPNFGENLIRREVDSQGADALYEIENGEKRIRISLFRGYPYWYTYYKAYLKFYTI